MKDNILNHLNDPRQLEQIYRADKVSFRKQFMRLYPDLPNVPLVNYWHERLAYEGEEIDWGSRQEQLLLILSILIAGITAKLPAILSIEEEFFYPRNIGFILFPALAAYFIYKNKLPKRNIIFIIGSGLLALIFINILPNQATSDTLTLACIHLLLLLWFILGIAYTGSSQEAAARPLDYLKYSGDLVVITGLLAIAGGMLTAITVGLFSLLELDIEEFYFNYVAVFAFPAAPIVGTYLIQNNPQLIGRITPTIARIFSPLVLLMLATYLIAMVYSGQDPYNDREFLLFFNALLIGVMAIIFYSVAESSHVKRGLEVWVLFLLSLLTIAVNGVALSAILFRITEWGITPNRTAVLGSNLLMLIHLLIISLRLYMVLWRKSELKGVGKAIAAYLPIYLIWAIIVIFLFPFLFGFS